MNTAAGHLTQEDSPSVPLWMLPFILLEVMLVHCLGWIARLKDQRRSRAFPANWKDHFERLRRTEWHIRQLVANGARQLLDTGTLDLRTAGMLSASVRMIWTPSVSTLRVDPLPPPSRWRTLPATALSSTCRKTGGGGGRALAALCSKCTKQMNP